MQAVGTGDEAGRPYLLADDRGRLRRLPLDGAFAWRIAPDRTCIGSWEAGRHVPCPAAAPVAGDAVCPACSGLEDPACVFEPRCAEGTMACHCAFGPVPHVVYAAFFGTLPKVGMTQAWRLPARLREQGADLYFPIAAAASRGEARSTERRIAFLHNIPEYRVAREVLAQLARPVPWDVVQARAQDLRDRLAPGFDASGPPVRIMDHRVAQPLPGVPRRVQPVGLHAGRWLGAKGPHLFYAKAGPGLDTGSPAVVALKRADLLGRQVEAVA